MMLKWALERKRSSSPADYILRFFEKDKKSYEALAQVVSDHASAGLDVVAERADAITRVDDVVSFAAGLPLFLFIDPTGVGLPFDVLVGALQQTDQLSKLASNRSSHQLQLGRRPQDRWSGHI